MDVTEHEAVWADAIAMAKRLAEETRIETFNAEQHLGWLNLQIMEYALRAQQRAMRRGEIETAMGFLETTLDARERYPEAMKGPMNPRPSLPFIESWYLDDAAIASRPDLIDRTGYRRIKDSIPQYQAIRAAVGREPGIRQIDLQAHCPGADNRTISKLVDRLAVVGILVTAKIGSRVHVWPEGHIDAPTGDRIRQPHDPAAPVGWDELPPWHANPEEPLQWALSLRHLIQTSLDNPEWDTSPVAEPADLSPIGLTAYEVEGHLCHWSEMPDEMVIWGHVDEAVLLRIFERYVEKAGVQSRRLKKWRTAKVRHTHLERVSHQGRVRKIWLLREAEEATETTIPITAFVSPGASPRSRPNFGEIIWLDRRDR